MRAERRADTETDRRTRDTETDRNRRAERKEKERQRKTVGQREKEEKERQIKIGGQKENGKTGKKCWKERKRRNKADKNWRVHSIYEERETNKKGEKERKAKRVEGPWRLDEDRQTGGHRDRQTDRQETPRQTKIGG